MLHIPVTLQSNPKKTGARTTKHTPKATLEKQASSCMFCCGERHSRDECPGKDVACRFCKSKGHFERACLKKTRAAITTTESSDDEDESVDFASVTVNAVKSTGEVFSKVLFEPQDFHPH